MIERRPPARDMRLLDFFSNNDLEPSSLHGALEAMSATSFARGVKDPELRVINSGSVGFRQHGEAALLERAAQAGDRDRKRGERYEEADAGALSKERVSKAQRNRETAALLLKVPTEHLMVLKLAFGPQDQVPILKIGPAVARNRENLDAIEATDRRDRLGPWRQVLSLTTSAKAAYSEWLARRGAGLGDRAAERRAERMVEAAEWLEAKGEMVAAAQAKLRQARELPDVKGKAAAVREAKRRLDGLRRKEEALIATDYRAAHGPTESLLQWLVDVATHSACSATLKAMKHEAEAMVLVAHDAWADVRGRQRAAERHDTMPDLR